MNSLLARSLVLGVAAGVVSGLFGVGGGVVVVPGAVLLLALDQYRAAGTSVAAIIASSSAALLLFASNGRVDWFSALLVFVGSGTGAWFGARFIKSIPEHVLTGAFALILVLAAVRMWL